MGRRLRIVSLLMVMSVVSASVPASADVELHFGTYQAVLVAQDIRFDAGLQLVSGVSGGVGLSPAPWFHPSIVVGVEKVNPSAISAGYQYRGLVARSIAVESIFSWGAPLSVGAFVAGRASLGSYENTFLLFFYPSLEVGPVVRLPLLWAQNRSEAYVEWSIVAAYHFRADLDVALSFGIRGRLGLGFRPATE